MRRVCGWLWLHEHPAFLRDTGRSHMCVRPPGHTPPHMCFCGDRITVRSKP